MLKAGFDPDIEWDLPEGTPPHEPTRYLDQEAALHRVAPKLYYYFKSYPNLRRVKKEQMFIQLLETLYPDDVKLLISAKDKRLTQDWTGLTYRLAEDSFPGLLPPSKENDEDGEQPRTGGVILPRGVTVPGINLAADTSGKVRLDPVTESSIGARGEPIDTAEAA